MRKPPLQDVIVKSPAGHRRTPVERRRPVEREAPHVHHDVPAETPPLRHNQSFDEPPMRRPRRPMNPANRRWLTIAIGIAAVIILSSVALSLMFAGATVTVYPKQDTVVVNATLLSASDGAQGALPFERVVLERTLEQDVVALGEEEVEERATGNITIYNEYSEAPQRLIKRTRFESTDGLVYRIQNAVEVPGMLPDGTPGTIEAEVVAEAAGEEYNIPGPMTFSVPGLEGFPQESLVYAKSEAPVSGGFIGIRRSIDENDRQTTLEQLEATLRDELLAEAFNGTGKPEGYQLFKDAIFFEFKALPDEVADKDKVTLSLSGKLHGVLFPEDAFAQRMAQLTLSTYTNAPIRIDNPEDISVTLEPTSEEGEVADMAPWNASRYTVSAQGKARFIWEFSDDQLAQDLAGRDEDILNAPVQGSILEGYPGIDRLEASIRPFWKGTFPEEPSDILVITELDD